MLPERVIGRYSGTEKGTLVICVGGMHGNEPAGVEAMSIMFDMLKVEPEQNNDFVFKGRLLGLRGNTRALAVGKRFIEKDLNRQWTLHNVTRIKASPIGQLEHEDLELKEMLQLIEDEIADYQPEKVVLLDLHTTTAFGGIFSIPTDDPVSLRLAIELHAPVIKGLLQGVKGTTLQYFNKENFDLDIVAVCFESGQHLEPLSVNRAIAAITNCLRTVGCVQHEYVENRHDSLLIEHSKGLPQIAELITIHPIYPGDNFQMAPNYKNFQRVKKGEVLAHDKKGPITAPEDSLILMPLYQKQGDDGFFLVKRLNQRLSIND